MVWRSSFGVDGLENENLMVDEEKFCSLEWWGGRENETEIASSTLPNVNANTNFLVFNS